jgi:N-acetylgalactosamine-6-sulfatase
VDDRQAMMFDLSASILAAADCFVPAGRSLDGIDILGQIAARRPPQPRTLFWRFRRGERTWRAVRDGDRKYVSREEAGKKEEFLFDLARNPGETTNLADRQPLDAGRLREKLARWEQEVRPARLRPASSQ